MQKFKRVYGGFPTRCVGCLLALCVLLNSFSCYALTLSNQGSYLLPNDVPDLTAIYENCVENHCNLLFFYDITNNRYCLVKTYDFRYINSSYPDILTTSSNYYDVCSSGGTNSVADTSYNQFWNYWNCTLGNTTWTQVSLSLNSNGYYFVSSQNWTLYAVYTPYSNLTATQRSIYTSRDRIGQSNYYNYIGPAALCCYFGSDGNLYYTATNEPVNQGGSQGQPNATNSFFNNVISKIDDIIEGITGLPSSFSNAIGNIQGWLNSVKSAITSKIGDIQGWLTSLGNTISNAIGNIRGWLTSLGDTLISPFIAGPPEGVVHKFFFTDIPTFFSNLGNTILSPFIAGPPEGVVHKFFFTDIPNFFTNLVLDIKGLFIPDAAFWTAYKTRWSNFFNTRFAGLIQAEQLIVDLYDTVSEDIVDNMEAEDYTLVLPAWRFTINSSSRTRGRITKHSYQPIEPMRSSNTITIFQGGTYSLVDCMFSVANYVNFDFWEAYTLAVNAVISIASVYHLKKFLMFLLAKVDI